MTQAYTANGASGGGGNGHGGGRAQVPRALRNNQILPYIVVTYNISDCSIREYIDHTGHLG